MSCVDDQKSGGAFFPLTDTSTAGGGFYPEPGVSLRDFAALTAMHALLSKRGIPRLQETVVDAFMAADLFVSQSHK